MSDPLDLVPFAERRARFAEAIGDAIAVIPGSQEARQLQKCRELALLRLYTGRYGPFPSIEEADAFPYTARDLAIIQHTRGRTAAGTPDVVREELEARARAYGVDELVVVTITHDFKARVRSYELLADAFGLKG